MKTNRHNGFSLIELLIAMSIAGIVAAISYPSYKDFMVKARRSDCKVALEGLSQALEDYRATNSTYDNPAPTLGFNPGDLYPNQCPIKGGTVRYNLNIDNITATTFAISAIPVGDQTRDECGTLNLDQNETKSMTGAYAGVTIDQCW